MIWMDDRVLSILYHMPCPLFVPPTLPPPSSNPNMRFLIFLLLLHYSIKPSLTSLQPLHTPLLMPSPLLLLLLLLLLSPPLSLSLSAASPPPSSSDLLHSSCIHARYPHLCLRTLSSYSRPSITPNDLAQAALSVSLRHARHISRFLHNHLPSPANPSALHDCAEQMSDSVDELRRSLRELRHLRSSTFQLQMSNAQTWVSASMTDDDTCLDGLSPVHGPVVGKIKRKINRVARVTSNALYMINRLCDSPRPMPNSEPSH